MTPLLCQHLHRASNRMKLFDPDEGGIVWRYALSWTTRLSETLMRVENVCSATEEYMHHLHPYVVGLWMKDEGFEVELSGLHR